MILPVLEELKSEPTEISAKLAYGKALGEDGIVPVVKRSTVDMIFSTSAPGEI